MNLFLRIAAVPACIVAFAAPPASATEPADRSLQTEVESYLAETTPPAPGDPTAKVEWKPGKGLTFATADKAFSAHIGGRLYWDNIWMSSDDYPSSETQDSTFFRTVRLEVDGTMFTNAFYKIQVDFAGGTVQLKDVYMGLKNCGPAGTFTAGHFKQPVSLEELTSSRFITFMERAACVSAFAPSREDGVMLNNNFLTDGMLGVFASLYRFGTNDQGFVADNGAWSFAVRFAAFFLEDKERNQVLHVGGSYSYISALNDSFQFRARPDIGTGSRFVDTGTFAAEDQNLFGAELMFLYKVFHVQLELLAADTDSGTFSGWYVEIGWFITGGQRHYSTDKKTVERPKIDRNFHAGGGGWGAWQVAFRFDTIDLTDSGIAGGVQDCYTIGANWYWNPHMRVMFNMIFADISNGGPLGDGSLTIFAMRFQVDF